MYRSMRADQPVVTDASWMVRPDTGKHYHDSEKVSTTACTRMILSDQPSARSSHAGRIGDLPTRRRVHQPSSVDLHVDRYFRVFRNHTQRVIDVRENQEELTELVESVGDDPLILHPGEFVLGSTLERVRLPTTSSGGWRESRASGDWAC